MDPLAHTEMDEVLYQDVLDRLRAKGYEPFNQSHGDGRTIQEERERKEESASWELGVSNAQ